jgi:magnesium-transporting ATPase (P-type)
MSNDDDRAPGMTADLRPVGLATDEARRRLLADGPNVLPEPARRRWWRDFLAQLTHFFARLLWAAAGLAFIAGMPQLGVAIVIVVVVNGLFAYWQEARAERAAAGLRDLLPQNVRVVRDGRLVEVPARDLVTGDRVLLGGGDRVSADMRMVAATSMTLDASLLTGESEPVPVEAGEVVHAGAFVVEGEGEADVVAAGAGTRLAEIARLTTQEPRRPTPLAIELVRVVRTIAAVAIGVGVGFFALALLIGEPLADGFLFGIGVTVALVPEGLLPTVTLSLAIGAQRMAARHALVRRLESVETLGSTTFICSDKTGTLTRNEMSVAEIWTPSGAARPHGEGYRPVESVDIDAGADDAVRALVVAARWCSTGRAQRRDDAWVAIGDPMDAAIDALAAGLGVEADDARVKARHPFDPRRRRMSVVVSTADRGDVLIVKGSPEAILGECIDALDGVSEILERMARSGLRVLAVATADLDPAHDAPGLHLCGLLAFADPPRDGVEREIGRCRTAGIRLAMVTGDHPATATAIADRVGLRRPGDPVLDGALLPADDEVLGAMVDHDGVVISRVSPEDKLRIARALQARGHVVAMTGDGVNDGPALRAADIGVAMGRSGTDVAREAADLVLLDDDFGTIVAAVDQGRATFANVRRFLTYHLTDNVAELTPFVVWALSGGRFPLAIGVLQVLFLDIGTDLLPALALGAERAHERDAADGSSARATAGARRARHLLDGAVVRRAFLVLGPTEALMSMLAFVASMLGSGWRPGDSFPEGAALATASGAAFTAIVIGQMANAFACRSMTRPAWVLGWRTNRLLVSAVAIEAVLLLVFLFVTPVTTVLEHRAPSWAGFAVAMLAAPAILGVDALDKRRRLRGMSAPPAPLRPIRDPAPVPGAPRSPGPTGSGRRG